MRYLERKGITDFPVKAAEFDPDLHPRDPETGEFSAGGGAAAIAADKPPEAKPDKDGVVRPKGQGGRFLPRKPSISDTPVPLAPPDVVSTPVPLVAATAAAPILAAPPGPAQPAGGGKKPFDQEAYEDRVAGGRFLDEVTGNPTGILRAEMTVAGEIKADIELNEMDRSLAGSPDRPPEAWDRALGRAHGQDATVPAAERAGADDLTRQSREVDTQDAEKISGYVSAQAHQEGAEKVSVNELASSYNVASDAHETAAQKAVDLANEERRAVLEESSLNVYASQEEGIDRLVAIARNDGLDPDKQQRILEARERLQKSGSVKLSDGRTIGSLTPDERTAALAAAQVTSTKAREASLDASSDVKVARQDRNYAMNRFEAAETETALKFAADFREEPNPKDAEEIKILQAAANEHMRARDKAQRSAEEIRNKIGGAIWTQEDAQRRFGTQDVTPGQVAQHRWATQAEKTAFQEARRMQAEAAQQMQMRLTQYNDIQARQSGIDFERGVNALADEYRRNPALYRAARDEMANNWKHIGGEGPMKLRFAAQQAFGLGYGSAFDAKVGFGNKFRKLGEWINEDRGNYANRYALRGYSVSKFAAVMRREYEESQEDLRRFADPDFEKKHPRNPDGTFMEGPDLPNPQAAFSFRQGGSEAKPGRHVTLYRAIKTGKRGYVPNYVESYAFTESAAREFGNRVIKIDVPVERILVFQGSRNWQSGLSKGAMGNREQEVLLLSDYPKSVRDWLRNHRS